MKNFATGLQFLRNFKIGIAAGIFGLALSLPHTASAEWQRVTTTDSGIIYVDDGTIKRNGPIRSFWRPMPLALMVLASKPSAVKLA